MKNFSKIILFNFCLCANISLAQNVVEVFATELSPLYNETLTDLENLRSNPEEALKLLTEMLPQITSPYERFNLIFWEIPALYCELGKYEEGFDVLKKGQQEGLFYPFIIGQNKFPPYVSNFEKFPDFQSFIDKNKKLREAAQLNAKFEYFVQLPKNYSKDKNYPLLIVLYGGFGNYMQQMQDWHSPKLESDFITTYMQGDQCMGSYLFSYQRENVNQFIEAYKQITDKYPIDTSKVLIGTQSAGAHQSFMLMLNEFIPVKGLILAFPGTPQLDLDKVKKAGERGVKVAILAGEYDPRIVKTKEMAVELDNHDLQNRFIIFSEKGHEFPDNFPNQIDLSLDFILGNSK